MWGYVGTSYDKWLSCESTLFFYLGIFKIHSNHHWKLYNFGLQNVIKAQHHLLFYYLNLLDNTKYKITARTGNLIICLMYFNN